MTIMPQGPTKYKTVLSLLLMRLWWILAHEVGRVTPRNECDRGAAKLGDGTTVELGVS